MSRDESRELSELAARLVEAARRAGADEAEVTARSGWELSTKVRMGEPELVEEAGHRGVSLRALRGGRAAMTSTSDLSEEGLERVVADAMELVELTEPDPLAGPAAPEQLATPPFPDLDLFDDSIASIDGASALERATRAERAAFDADDRLGKLSEGATFSRVSGTSAMVLSTGFTGVQRGSYASLVVVPVVEDAGGKRRRGFYWSAKRHAADMETPEQVGAEAARRTLRQLGARKVKSGKLPIVFDADAARSILGTFAGCIVGDAIWRQSSYLIDREGSEVASKLVTIVDDPLIPRAPGSRPWDGEGLPSRRNVVVDEGVLRTFLLDLYGARKLDRESTASASRAGGHVGASTTNFVLSAGDVTREQLIRETGTGLFVTEMMGFGFNAVTGDFSRGASGMWIDDGELAHPVSEVTISGNLNDMLLNIDAVADDLELKSATASPTFRIAEMTIAGD